MKFWPLIAFLVLPSVAFSQNPHNQRKPALPEKDFDLTEISVGMSSDDFQTREDATLRLLELSRNNLPELATALFREARTTRDPEIRFRSRATFKRIFEFRVLGKGDANLGVTWHWHIQQNFKDEMRARPLVRALDPKSPAAKAGLKKGDIVCYVNDKELPRQNGIPALRKILREATPGSELTFTVRSIKFQNDRLTGGLSKNRKVTLTVRDTKKGLRVAEKGEFEKWFANLKALHDHTG